METILYIEGSHKFKHILEPNSMMTNTVSFVCKCAREVGNGRMKGPEECSCEEVNNLVISATRYIPMPPVSKRLPSEPEKN